MDLTLLEARRLALAAQGFDRKRPAKVGSAKVADTIDRLGAVQVDAVNVLVRSHYLPLFSRLGPYDRALLDRATYRTGRAFEYWAHAASIVSTEMYPALRWRMREHETSEHWHRSRQAVEARNPGYFDRVLAEITDRGPLSFNELADPARRDRPKTHYSDNTLLWWSDRPSDGKYVLEHLWRIGRLAVAGRGPGFERRFDLAERVIPAEVLNGPELSQEEGEGALVAHAATALGIGWVKDFSDYYRLPVANTKARLRELVEEGVLQIVTVEGVDPPAYVASGTKAGKVTARALLSPFDSLLWERARNVRLLGFTHSFEIYLPEAKRRYGYFVLPFLLGEDIRARVDLKADRAGSALLVRSAHLEAGADIDEVAPPLATELRDIARWLGLSTVKVDGRAGLAKGLRSVLS